MTHSRKQCPGRDGSYCRSHRWPPDQARLERQNAAAASHPTVGERETARRPSFKWQDAGKRSAALDRQVRRAHEENSLRHEIELLTAAAQRVLDEARTQRGSKYDGARLIEQGKRRRRELIAEAHRVGLGQLR